MKLLWTALARTNAYRNGTQAERRFLEIKFALAGALRRLRQRSGLTQAQLADHLGADQSTISRLERAASRRVTIDLYVWTLILLDASDADLASAFNAAGSAGVQRVRQRAALRLFPKPADIRRNDRNHHHRRRAAARPDDRHECGLSKRAARGDRHPRNTADNGGG